MTLEHFPPYFICDDITDDEKAAFDELSDEKKARFNTAADKISRAAKQRDRDEIEGKT